LKKKESKKTGPGMSPTRYVLWVKSIKKEH